MSHALTNRKRWCCRVEPLETRQLLSASAQESPGASGAPLAITLRIDPAFDPAHDGVVAVPRVALDGLTAPGAIVLLRHAGQTRTLPCTVADTAGLYQFAVNCVLSTTPFTVRATDTAGQQASTNLTVTRANTVIAWNAVALQAIRNTKTQAPDAARDLAIVQVAVDDAVNSIDRTHRPDLVRFAAPRGASSVAAADAAAHRALVALFPEQAATFDAALDAMLAEVHDGSAEAGGVAVGERVAAAVLAGRAGDGSTTPVAYTPGTEPGQWRPTPPANAQALLPQWGDVTPFSLARGSQFRPHGLPSLTSRQYAIALDEVERLGGANSTARTADQTEVAAPADPAVPVLRLGAQHRRMTAVMSNLVMLNR